MEGKGERREKKEEEHSSFLLIMNDLLFREAMAKPRRGPLNRGSHDAHRHTHTHTHRGNTITPTKAAIHVNGPLTAGLQFRAIHPVTKETMDPTQQPHPS